jgi:hypothetical protein
MPDAQVPNFPQDERVSNAPGTSAVQSIKVDGTSGTFGLIFDGVKIAKTVLAFNITAQKLEEELITHIPGLNDGDINVTGGPGNSGGTKPYVVTFIGTLANQPVPAFTAESELAGGGAAVTISQTVAGVLPSTKGVQVGTGLANRNAEANPLEVASPAEKHTTNSGSVYE